MVVQRNTEKGEYEEVTLKVTLGAKKDMPDSLNENSSKKGTKDETAPNDGYGQQGEAVTPEEFFGGFEEFFGE